MQGTWVRSLVWEDLKRMHWEWWDHWSEMRIMNIFVNPGFFLPLFSTPPPAPNPPAVLWVLPPQCRPNVSRPSLLSSQAKSPLMGPSPWDLCSNYLAGLPASILVLWNPFSTEKLEWCFRNLKPSSRPVLELSLHVPQHSLCPAFAVLHNLDPVYIGLAPLMFSYFLLASSVLSPVPAPFFSH